MDKHSRMIRFVPIRSFDNYIYANILLSRLKQEGFDCYLKDENTVTIDPLLSPAIGGMKIMVPEEDAAKALTMLDLFENDYVATVPCPQCGESALQRLVTTDSPTNPIVALFYQLFLGSAKKEHKFYRCSNCGAKMDDLPV